ECPREVDNDADQLCEELAGVAVEQAGHFAGLPVPAGAIRTVGEEPQGDQPPGTVDTVDGDGAAGVVDVGDMVEEPDAAAYEEAGDQSDQACCPGRHERAGCGDGDEAGQHA